MKKLFVLFFLLSACGGDYQPMAVPGEAFSLLGQTGRLLSADGLAVTESKIEGQGSLLFDQSFSEFRTGASYALDFSLVEGGRLTLVSHGHDDLSGGFELEFQRRGSGPGSLKVTLRASGRSLDTINAHGIDMFGGMDAAGPLRFQIDVHNNESPAHLLVWSRLLSDNFAEDQALLNTEDDVDLSHGSPGIGVGTRWGLRLENAILTRAQKGNPVFSE